MGFKHFKFMFIFIYIKIKENYYLLTHKIIRMCRLQNPTQGFLLRWTRSAQFWEWKGKTATFSSFINAWASWPKFFNWNWARAERFIHYPKVAVFFPLKLTAVFGWLKGVGWCCSDGFPVLLEELPLCYIPS